MPIDQNNLENSFEFDMNNHDNLKKLNALQEALEKYLLSNVRVRKSSLSAGYCDLVIEIDCDFSFEEVLICIRNVASNSMVSLDNSYNQRASHFFNALFKLYSQYREGIDIDELVINLKDTTIIIGRIFDQSIPNQLENIFTSLANHHVNFTREMDQLPYEIYIPVFEDNSFQNENTLENKHPDTTNYFGFWGLYFESEDDAVIYDLKQRMLAWGDLVMLNH